MGITGICGERVERSAFSSGVAAELLISEHGGKGALKVKVVGNM